MIDSKDKSYTDLRSYVIHMWDYLIFMLLVIVVVVVFFNHQITVFN